MKEIILIILTFALLLTGAFLIGVGFLQLSIYPIFLVGLSLLIGAVIGFIKLFEKENKGEAMKE